MAPLRIELGWPAAELNPNTGWWTDAEIEELRQAYASAKCGEEIGLDALAAKLGRHKTNVSRKARELGLTDIRRPLKLQRKDRRKYKGDKEALREGISKARRENIAKNGHPRGMLGKKHTAEVRRLLGEKSAAYWSSLTEEQKQTFTDKMQRAAREAGPPKVARGTWKAGWREIGGKRHYFRSRWEANYARWLQSLKDCGEIEEWEFEPHVFWFDKIKRGVRSYKPDFRVTGGIEPGQTSWHEIKGWMDARSKTTLKRMAKYHPDEFIFLVDSPRYAQLEKACRHLIDGWEQ